MTPTANTPVEIRVCAGSGCVANGSLEAAAHFEAAIAEAQAGDSIRVVRTGCHGLCAQGPVVVVAPHGTFYPGVDAAAADRIVAALLAGEGAVRELLYREDPDTVIELHDDIEFNARQHRIVLRNCGVIDPEDIDSALAAGVYSGLERALTLTPEQVIDTVLASGLRGRGGAGFPTGMKWRLAREADGDTKYMICNADEGDPGAFMDRAVLEGDPHSVIEGLAIAAYAIGASRGFVYVRAEYPLAVRRLRKAIEDANGRGFLGRGVAGSPFEFELEVREGAGAFVCGEETALIASIEGHRGMPRPRPPYPTTSGLWGKPTCINNVESLANVGWILSHGAEAYAHIGTRDSNGTKVFAITGKVRHTGLVEVPFGLTVREMVEGIGGGSSTDSPLKAVQIGGPSGGCLPESEFDTPIEYSALIKAGAIVGSGGLVVADESTCMVEMARYFLAFTQDESCGKCVPCRVGTKRMLEIVTRITEGQGREGDLEALEELADTVRNASLCGLGQTAPNPVLTTLRYFRDEYDEHIRDKRCRAHACTALSKFEVVPEACRGCGICKKKCPVHAISGDPKQVHHIDKDVCVACGACYQACPFEAIIRT